MEKISLKGTPCHTSGTLPKVGTKAPEFTLVASDLSEIHATDFEGKQVILNIFPSLDTPVCAASVRRFNQDAAQLDNTVVLCVSMDLPFAAGRFCEANGIKNVMTASAFRSIGFDEKYGVRIVDGPLAGLLARAVIVIDSDQNVVYTELVPEITEEPCYDKVLEVLRK